MHSVLQATFLEDGIQVERHFEDCCCCLLGTSASLLTRVKSGLVGLPARPHPIYTPTLKALKRWSVYVFSRPEPRKAASALEYFSGQTLLSPTFNSPKHLPNSEIRTPVTKGPSLNLANGTGMSLFCCCCLRRMARMSPGFLRPSVLASWNQASVHFPDLMIRSDFSHSP